jgi:hypothetical protein
MVEKNLINSFRDEASNNNYNKKLCRGVKTEEETIKEFYAEYINFKEKYKDVWDEIINNDFKNVSNSRVLQATEEYRDLKNKYKNVWDKIIN